MKKIILILLVLGIGLTVKANEQKLNFDKHIVYTETCYSKGTFRLNYDTNQIHININGFENKVFKFNKFSNPKRVKNNLESYTEAISDDVVYELKQVYELSTGVSFILFTNKKTGGTIEYRFG
jgi:hypothetical protein